MEGSRGQEDQRGKIPSFETHPFAQLFFEMNKAQSKKKFLFVADMTGKASTACSYGTCQYFSLHGQQKNVLIHKTQKIEAAVE